MVCGRGPRTTESSSARSIHGSASNGARARSQPSVESGSPQRCGPFSPRRERQEESCERRLLSACRKTMFARPACVDRVASRPARCGMPRQPRTCTASTRRCRSAPTPRPASTRCTPSRGRPSRFWCPTGRRRPSCAPCRGRSSGVSRAPRYREGGRGDAGVDGGGGFTFCFEVLPVAAVFRDD